MKKFVIFIVVMLISGFIVRYFVIRNTKVDVLVVTTPTPTAIPKGDEPTVISSPPAKKTTKPRRAHRRVKPAPAVVVDAPVEEAPIESAAPAISVAEETPLEAPPILEMSEDAEAREAESRMRAAEQAEAEQREQREREIAAEIAGEKNAPSEISKANPEPEPTVPALSAEIPSPNVWISPTLGISMISTHDTDSDRSRSVSGLLTGIEFGYSEKVLEHWSLDSSINLKFVDFSKSLDYSIDFPSFWLPELKAGIKNRENASLSYGMEMALSQQVYARDYSLLEYNLQSTWVLKIGGTLAHSWEAFQNFYLVTDGRLSLGVPFGVTGYTTSLGVEGELGFGLSEQWSEGYRMQTRFYLQNGYYGSSVGGQTNTAVGISLNLQWQL